MEDTEQTSTPQPKEAPGSLPIEQLDAALADDYGLGTVKMHDQWAGFYYDRHGLGEEPDAMWELCCEIQRELRVHGWEIEDPYIDHRSVGGLLVKCAKEENPELSADSADE